MRLMAYHGRIVCVRKGWFGWRFAPEWPGPDDRPIQGPMMSIESAIDWWDKRVGEPVQLAAQKGGYNVYTVQSVRRRA